MCARVAQRGTGILLRDSTRTPPAHHGGEEPLSYAVHSLHLIITTYSQKFALQIKATLENVESLKPEDESSIGWNVKVSGDLMPSPWHMFPCSCVASLVQMLQLW